MTLPKVLLLLGSVLLLQTQVGADGHVTESDGHMMFTADMCRNLNSTFLTCICDSYEMTIQGIVTFATDAFQFPDDDDDDANFTIITQAITAIARNLSQSALTGMCSNLTGLQSCLDTDFMSSSMEIDLILKAIMNVSNLATALNSTFCHSSSDMMMLDTCVENVTGPASLCVGLNGESLEVFSTVISAGNIVQETFSSVVQSTYCPTLGDVGKCVLTQTYLCGADISMKMNYLIDQLMTTGCRSHFDQGTQSLLASAVLNCGMPAALELLPIFQELDDEERTDSPATDMPEPIITSEILVTVEEAMPEPIITSEILVTVEEAIEHICRQSYFPYVTSCMEREVPNSMHVLDRFFSAIVDFPNLAAVGPSLFDNLCSELESVDLNSLAACIVGNFSALQPCVTNSTYLDPFGDIFGDGTQINVTDAATIRSQVCSPIMSMASCIVDGVGGCHPQMTTAVENLRVQMMRTDCWGIRPTTPVPTPIEVGDGASALGSITSIYLLAVLLAQFLKE